jgi:CRP/FNR family transcriptional regulator
MVDRTQYLHLLEQNGDLAVRVIKLLSLEMGASLEDTDQFAFASARERIAGLLLELAERYGEESQGGTRISLELKREELAQMAAMTVETLVRLLQSFQVDQVIRLKGRQITILLPDRLARASRKIPPARR